MNIWNTVFLVLVFILSGVAAFFTAQEMKIRQEWNRGIERLETKISNSEKEIREAINGVPSDKPEAERTIEELALSTVKVRLRNLIFERGKAWFECQPGQVTADGQVLMPQQLGGNDPQTEENRLKPIQLVEVRLMITGPVVEKNGKEEVIPPNDLKGLVYLFDEGQDNVGTQFLGRFTVSAVQPSQSRYQVTLIAANELNQNEVERIEASRKKQATWAVYTAVPIDRYEGVFDRLPDDVVDSILSASAPKDRKLTVPDLKDPERKTVDFDVLLTKLYQWRVVLKQDIDRTKRYIEMLKSSVESAKAEEGSLKKDIDFEKKRIAAMKTQAETLQKAVDQYDEMIQELTDLIDKTQKQNKWYVAQIAQAQHQAAEQIEKRAEEAVAE